MKQILAVDIGTTSAKAMVVNEHGEVLSTAQKYYPTQNPEPDYAEQDPEEIFSAVTNIIRLAVDGADVALDGARAEDQAVGDLGVGEAGGEEAEDFDFAGGQLG